MDNKKIVDATALIIQELGKIVQKKVTPGEFTRAKDYYIGQILLGLEDTLEHMFWVGEGTVTLNKTRTLKEILNEVKKVNIADIRRVANNVFKENNINLAVVGPLNDKQEKNLSNLIGAK